MKPSVVIYGPQGCGKSLHGPELADHYGVRHILDEGLDAYVHKREGLPAHGHLVLCVERPRRLPPGVRVIPFDQAMREAGIPDKRRERA